MLNKKIGDIGEEIAFRFLKSKGYFLIEKNYMKTPYGEIDLVLKKEKKIYFVEVKSTRVKLFSALDNIKFSPKDHLNSQKIKKFERIGKIYIKEKKLEKIRYHFFAILVYFNENTKEARIKIIDQL